jgi:hypothetical protein
MHNVEAGTGTRHMLGVVPECHVLQFQTRNFLHLFPFLFGGLPVVRFTGAIEDEVRFKAILMHAFRSLVKYESNASSHRSCRETPDHGNTRGHIHVCVFRRQSRMASDQMPD